LNGGSLGFSEENVGMGYWGINTVNGYKSNLYNIWDLYIEVGWIGF